MKFVLLAVLAVSAVGCGKNDVLRANLRSLAGVNSKAEKDVVGGVDARVGDLETQVASLESRFSTLEGSVADLTLSYEELAAVQAATQQQLDELDEENTEAHTQLSALLATQTARLNTLDAQMTSVQAQANATQTALTELVADLDAENRIVRQLDPCGDLAGHYDEILLVTNHGDVFAYFESGSKRHITKLIPNTSYQTTDVQACTFKVDASGNLM